MSAQNISIAEFKQEVLDSDKAVLVDFWAPWCGPCLMMAPVLDQLSEDDELKDDLKITKVNTEEGDNRNLAIQYQIRSIPNMKLFYKGEVGEEFIGARPAPAMKTALKEALAKLDK